VHDGFRPSHLPATAHRREYTIPLMEMTAMSVVPPPMSTTMLPEGFSMGSPAPIAAASGLLHQVDFTGASAIRRVLDGSFFHRSDFAGYAYDERGCTRNAPVVRLLNE